MKNLSLDERKRRFKWKKEIKRIVKNDVKTFKITRLTQKVNDFIHSYGSTEEEITLYNIHGWIYICSVKNIGYSNLNVPKTSLRANALVYALDSLGAFDYDQDKECTKKGLVEILGYEYLLSCPVSPIEKTKSPLEESVKTDISQSPINEGQLEEPTEQGKSTFKNVQDAQQYCNKIVYKTAVVQLESIFKKSELNGQRQILEGLESLISRLPKR